MVSQQSHGDSFKAKDIIIVSSKNYPAPNDYVVAITASKKSPILFRQLLLRRNNYFLNPLNDEYATLLLKPPIKIIAVVVEQRKQF